MNIENDYKYFDPAVIERAQKENPFVNISSVVKTMIEEAIIDQALYSGTKINVMRIAKELGISRTPVKDALDQLEETGIVFRKEDQGYHVFELNGAFMDQMFDARMIIEGGAAYICAKHASELDTERLRMLAEEFRQAKEEGDYEQFKEADSEFHNLISEWAENSFIHQAGSDLFKYMRLYFNNVGWTLARDGYSRFSEFDMIVDQHRSIAEAIALGIPQMAEQAMRNHIETVHRAYYCLLYK